MIYFEGLTTSQAEEIARNWDFQDGCELNVESRAGNGD